MLSAHDTAAAALALLLLVAARAVVGLGIRPTRRKKGA